MEEIVNLDKLKYVGDGRDGIIFYKRREIIKVPSCYWGDPVEHKKEYGESSLKNEYDVHLDLYNKGIKVPKPYDLVNISWHSKKGIGLMMERIYGINLENLLFFKKFFHQKMIQEVKKAKDLGFKLNDRRDINTLINFKGEIFLIDFNDCESPK